MNRLELLCSNPLIKAERRALVDGRIHATGNARPQDTYPPHARGWLYILRNKGPILAVQGLTFLSPQCNLLRRRRDFDGRFSMNKTGTAKQPSRRRLGRKNKATTGSTRADVASLGSGSKRYVLRTRSRGRGDVQADAVVLDPRQVPQVAYYIEAKRGFPTDSALAEAMGVHRSQITRWKAGEAAESENAWLLRDIASAVSRLADHYEPSTVHAWLYGENQELEGRQPIELLHEGRLPEVLMVIQAETSGAYI
jgi:hypothetical protein